MVLDIQGDDQALLDRLQQHAEAVYGKARADELLPQLDDLAQAMTYLVDRALGIRDASPLVFNEHDRHARH